MFIASCLKDARAELLGEREVSPTGGKSIPLTRPKAPKTGEVKKRSGEKACILCGERPAQEGMDVCFLCEQEDVGTALIYDLPKEEVP